MKTLFLSISIPLALGAAACTGGADDAAIPSASSDDGSPPAATLLSAAGEQPCGYEYWRDHLDFGQTTPTKQIDWLATITYDVGGHDIAEHAVDATTGAVALDQTTTYDAMGNFTKLVQTQGGAATYTMWASYDSFGRMIRYSADQTGDGIEDWIATYVYGGDGRRTSAHLIDPDGTIYDRAYHYQADGRLGSLGIDYGPDGTIDQTQSFTYDDAARTQTRQTVATDGTQLGHGSTTYDGDGRVLVLDDVNTDIAHDAGYGYDQGETDTYDGDREVSVVYDDKEIRPSDGAVTDDVDHYVWKYDHCQ